MMDEETIKSLKKALIGKSCVGMENIGNYLQLLFADRRLIVESAWRLLQEDGIIIGSDSDGQVLENLEEMLIGLTITDISLKGDFNDLQLFFEGGKFSLETFADSQEFEHWKLSGNGEMIIAGPGNLWSIFDMPLTNR